jgi:hypothetical protein
MATLIPFLFFSLALRSDSLLPATPFNEDSFFYFAVARDASLGRIFVNSRGDFVNGFQPLYALGLAVLFSFTRIVFGSDANPYLALRLVYTVQIIGLVGSCFLFGLIAENLFGKWMQGLGDWRSALSVLLGCLWFTGNYTLFTNSLNGLETGLVFLLLLVLIYCLTPHQRSRWEDMFFAPLAGLLVLARIDTVPFVVCAIFIFHKARWISWVRYGIDYLLFGLVCGWWFVLNLVLTGTPIPSSGLAYDRVTVEISVNENVEKIIAGLATSAPFENLFISKMLGFIPGIPSDGTVRTVASAALVCLFTALYILFSTIYFYFKDKAEANSRYIAILFVGGIYGATLILFYTTFFGAPWFISRYLAPLAIFLTLLELGVFFSGLDWLSSIFHSKRWRLGLSLLVIGVCLYLYRYSLFNLASATRPIPITTYIDHYALVKDFPSSTTIASFQSGVLSYFLPGTVNLDGKMNLDAVRAIRNGNLYEYICRTDVNYIVDWQFMFKRNLPDRFFSDFVEVETKRRDGYITTLYQRVNCTP